MKRTSLILLIAVLLSMVGTNAYADWHHKVRIGALYYYLDYENDRAQVTSGEEYSGDITIPSQIEYNNNEYSVTGIGDWTFIRCVGLTSRHHW